MGKMCVICGKVGFSYYPFCREHLQMKNDGKIVKCDVCGIWHFIDKSCNCRQSTVNVEKKNSVEVNALKCIICGQQSNGFHFCRECYAKYKDRSVDIRITNCTETEILDDYGNKQYKCDDGRWVRSRAEKIINDFLFKEGVRTVYEKKVYYVNDKGENDTLSPDYYLPDYNYYIEYNELQTKAYLKSKEYTQKIYNKLGLKVVIITDKELYDIEACLKPLLGLH